ncbi:MAG: type II secretion system inner membrane protein GspF [Nitrospirae bacterium]|nr:type II secretion system inner membrane protein GspF [Candidatus Troglogloeales bacterium]
MAVYEYKGFDSQGKGTTGMMEAESPRLARLKLRQDGIFTTDLTPVEETQKSGGIFFQDKIPLSETAVMTRQLATLLGSDVPLMEALAALIEQVEKPVHKQVWVSVRDRVREGASFADALGQHPKTFSSLYQQMVKAGEASGTLDLILVRMSQYLEAQVTLRKKIFSILAYPVLMMILSGLILLFLISFVVPKVTSIFSDMHQALPLPTIVLLGISDFLRNYGWVFILLVLFGIVGLKRYIATPGGRWHFDRVTIKLPFVGRLFKIMAVARFAKTLATLLEAGIPLLPALAIVQEVVGNKVVEEAIEKARENIREGEGIAEPLKKSGLFPPLLTHLIAVGEKSGELEPMLNKVSQSYENEVETTITTLTSLLGPFMILAMGGVVLFIVLAVLLPIFDLSQIVK